MATILQCDKCGRIVKKIFKLKFEIIDPSIDNSISHIYDYCESCNKDFREFARPLPRPAGCPHCGKIEEGV